MWSTAGIENLQHRVESKIRGAEGVDVDLYALARIQFELVQINVLRRCSLELRTVANRCRHGERNRIMGCTLPCFYSSDDRIIRFTDRRIRRETCTTIIAIDGVVHHADERLRRVRNVNSTDPERIPATILIYKIDVANTFQVKRGRKVEIDVAGATRVGVIQATKNRWGYRSPNTVCAAIGYQNASEDGIANRL